MNSSRFKQQQLKYLAQLLHCLPSEILYVCDNIHLFYGKWVEDKMDKKGNVKRYPDTTPKQRIIRPSYSRLKKIQVSINRNIFSKVPMPSNVHGGIKGKSNISNAKVHQGHKYRFCTDLQAFYPSVNSDQVYKMFLGLHFSPFAASWLTKLTTIERELPQGAPTSTSIANLVFLPIDLQLIKLSQDNAINYTRYVDDLSFSSSTDFRERTLKIIDIVIQGGFKINYRKTHFQANQTITGINVYNNFIDTPEKIKLKVKSEESIKDNFKPYTSYYNRVRSTNTNMKRDNFQ
jgi:RNA-directed DNA polymerase